MRVVLFSHEYPPFLFGGAGIFVKDLANGLADMGLDVTVISGIPVPWENRQSSVLDNGQDRITTIRLRYPNVPPRHTNFQLFNSIKLKRILGCIKPDVIHGQSGSSFPAMVSIGRKTPFLVTFHSSPSMVRLLARNSIAKGGTFGDFFNGVIGYPAWECGYRLEHANASARVAVSKSLMKQLSTEMRVAESSFHLIRNGVDVGHLDRLKSMSSTEDSAVGKPFLLFGGRLFWGKGVMHLLDLAYLLEKRHHLDLDIVIYGSGPMYGRIIQLKKKYGLENVVLRRFTSRSSFIQVMMNAMCVLIPSPFEGAPMVLLESMCLGKIPIMFNLPYAREFTENGRYGILCNDIQDMALKIKELYCGSSRPHFEMQIRDFARENYSMNKTSMAYDKLYKKLAH